MRRPPDWKEFPKFPVTAGVMLLAAGVSLAKFGERDVSRLYETVAIRQGEIWRLITSTLPHANIVHLVFNLYCMWVFGTVVEKAYGHLRTAAIYLLFAVVANGAEYAILVGGIGLSGIGYGLFGLLWVLSRRDPEFREVVDKNTISLFVIWFFACIVMTLAGTPIGNIAHGVGAGAGALPGYVITARGPSRLAGAGAIAIVAAAVLLGSTVGRPWINFSHHGDGEAKLGYDALIANRNDEALHWFQDAIRIEPGSANYWYNYGIALDRLQRTAEAKAAFRRAAELDPAIGKDRSQSESAG
jgi:membrane associated rhomboid family serine protease